MRIPEEILGAAEKQLDADCGIGKEGKDGMIVTAQNKTVFRRAPYFPPKAYMTDAAYGELVRETLEKETGIRPRIYEGSTRFSEESSLWERRGFWREKRFLTGV